MDTLCSDLCGLVNKYQPINHLILLGHNYDCSEYLNMTKIKDRLKKARAENNYHWINWCLMHLPSSSQHGYGYEAYILGKSGDIEKIYQLHFSFYSYCLKGLCKRQHKEQVIQLLNHDKYLSGTFLKYLPLFDDEDFIINTITILRVGSDRTVYLDCFIKNMIKKNKYDLLYYILSTKKITINELSAEILFDIIKNNRLDFLLMLYDSDQVFLSLSTIKNIEYLVALNPKINIAKFLSEHQHLDTVTIPDITEYPHIRRLIDSIGPYLVFNYADCRICDDICNIMSNALDTTIIYHIKHSPIDIIKKIFKAVYLYNDRCMKSIMNTLKQIDCKNSTFVSRCLKYNDLSPGKLLMLAKLMRIEIAMPTNKNELLFALVMNTY